MPLSVDIGLTQDTCQEISDMLCRILANEYFLYQKTLSFHWNITGETFISLHELLEDHYEWLKETIDILAERIRALGFIAPGSYKKYSKEATLHEAIENLTAQQMLKELVASHTEVICQIRDTITHLADKKDYATEDILIQVLKEHEKNTWMLRSHLLEEPIS